MTDSPDQLRPLSYDPQFAEARGFDRLHHVGGDRYERELALEQQRRFAGRLVGFSDLLKQMGRTKDLGAAATFMKAFADLYPEFLDVPETEEQQRLKSLYESAMDGEAT